MDNAVIWDQINATTYSIIESRTMDSVVSTLHTFLEYADVPEPHPTAEQVTLSLAVAIGVLLGYWIFLGRKHHFKRYMLNRELNDALDKVKELQQQLSELEAEMKEEEEEEREIRIWMDGAFDLFHYGHMNAFRQGKSIGTHLIVGVNSDESITQCKGPPLLNEEERMACVSACKFVDEVVPNVPYVMNQEYLNNIIETYNIDYVIHGDDPCIVDGKDVYATAKEAGKYKSIPRTEGVSTTDIVGRMLLMSKEHHKTTSEEATGQLASQRDLVEQLKGKSSFFTTSHMIRLFSVGVKAPPSSASIVYVDGSWDMFHAGHVSFLQRARELGDYLIVGVHSDSLVNLRKGLNYPFMNLHERVLSILGCKYADDVLIDAPWKISQEMIASLNIKVVARGSEYYEMSNLQAWLDKEDKKEDANEREGNSDDDESEESYDEEDDDQMSEDEQEWELYLKSQDPKEKVRQLLDRYEIPKDIGIFQTVETDCTLTVRGVLERVRSQQQRFTKKYLRKKKAEDDYYKNRYKIDKLSR